jgi:[ribosomal protein S5]-alanine N-acetyltransferase
MADAPSIAASANDRRIWLQLRDLFPHPYALVDAETYIAHVGALDPPLSFAIVVEGRAVGGVGLSLMSDVNRCSAEIGYWLGAEYWGRGIGTEAVRLVTAWGFKAHRLLRIFATPFADNGASRRVLEKSGFRLEGTMRCSAVKDGRVRAQALYARLAPE